MPNPPPLDPPSPSKRSPASGPALSFLGAVPLVLRGCASPCSLPLSPAVLGSGPPPPPRRRRLRAHASPSAPSQANLTIAHVAGKYSPTPAGVLSTLVDFFALAHCTHFVLPSSGFSMVAAWRAGRPYLLNPFPKPCLGHMAEWCPVGRYPRTFRDRRDPVFQWGAAWRACAAPRPVLPGPG